MSIELQLF